MNQKDMDNLVGSAIKLWLAYHIMRWVVAIILGIIIFATLGTLENMEG